MNAIQRCTVGLLLGLGLSLSMALPAFAEPGAKAAIVLERIEEQIAYRTAVLMVTKAELQAIADAVRAK